MSECVPIIWLPNQLGLAMVSHLGQSLVAAAVGFCRSIECPGGTRMSGQIVVRHSGEPEPHGCVKLNGDRPPFMGIRTTISGVPIDHIRKKYSVALFALFLCRVLGHLTALVMMQSHLRTTKHTTAELAPILRFRVKPGRLRSRLINASAVGVRFGSCRHYSLPTPRVAHGGGFRHRLLLLHGASQMDHLRVADLSGHQSPTCERVPMKATTHGGGPGANREVNGRREVSVAVSHRSTSSSDR
jgi:hypothetical protein